MSDEHWPFKFRSAVEEVFGKKIDRTTYEVLSRRVGHAFKVWRRRYSMTPEQEVYAWELLSWAVGRAGWFAANRPNIRHPYVYIRRAVADEMERVVNDPNGHEGFKRRSELVDVSPQLREMLS